MLGRTPALLAALVVALSLGACDDGLRGRPYYSYGPDNRPWMRCEQLTSCESCTPVLGCGWCSSPAGNGCVTGPDECPGQSFSFTWDVQGCGFGADGGVKAPDSGAAPDGSH